MPIKINVLSSRSIQKGLTPAQPSLVPVAEAELDGIGMGVLSDGTPYLSQRGLAAICGVQNRHIGDISTEWQDTEQKPRITAIKNILSKSVSILPPSAHIRVNHAGVDHFCYPADVSLAIMEYYAFDAGVNCRPKAIDSFRLLAGSKLRELIYKQVGFKPKDEVPLAWKAFLDRVSLSFNRVPAGHFSIFKEIADLTELLIRSGANIGATFIPDGSVGQHWAKYWKRHALAASFGERIKYLLDYPKYFPQAASNPQHPYCYPDAALPEFRRWMWEDYLPNHFPSYLANKVKDGGLPALNSEKALKAIQQQVASRRLTS